MSMNSDSGNVEWYTPKPLVDRVRSFYNGNIDLDPASCRYANENIVNANVYFTQEHNGLNHPWFGNVWVNHPYGVTNNRLWSKKIVEMSRLEAVDHITGICFASTSEPWCFDLISNANAICILSPRINFVSPEGIAAESTQKGSLLYYFGSRAYKFKKCFEGKLFTQTYGKNKDKVKQYTGKVFFND